MYLLDTNIISYWMRGDMRVIGRIKKHSPTELSLSTITLAEILYGIEKPSIKKKERHVKEFGRIGKLKVEDWALFGGL